MSASQNFYVGPYLIAETKLVPVSTTKLTCSNVECKAHGQYHGTFNPDKFCSTCGSPVKETTFEEQGLEVSRWEVLENINEKMFCPLEESIPDENKTICHYWTSNRTEFDIKINRETSLEDEEKATEITENMIYSELKAFQEFHKEDIEKIKNSGYDRVELHWGVIVYYI